MTKQYETETWIACRSHEDHNGPFFHIDGEQMPTLPPPEQIKNRFNKSMKETLGEAMDHAKELGAMLEVSGMSQKKIDAMLRQLSMVTMNIGSNVEYVAEVFGEHMEGVLASPKTEIEAYAIATVQRAGLTALQGTDNVVSLESPTPFKELK